MSKGTEKYIREAGEAATPAHRFRIASVIKPITSVAIFSLIEAGRIRLTDRVFGPGAIIPLLSGRIEVMNRRI